MTMTEFKQSTSPQDKTTRQAVLVGRSVTFIAFLFLAAGVYLAIQTGGWQPYVFIFLAMQAIPGTLAGSALLQRGRATFGGWLILATTLIAPALTSLLFVSVGFVSIAFILITAFFIIRYAMPRETQRSALVSALIALVMPIVAEWVQPAWRLESQFFLTISPILTAILGVVFIVVIARQTWAGSMRNKLVVAFIGVTVVATGALGVFMYTTTTNNLRDNLERELTQIALDRATRIGDLFNEQINALTTLSMNEGLQDAVDAQNSSYEDSATIQSTLDTKDAQWRTADEADNNNHPLVRENLTNKVAQELLEYQQGFPSNVEVFITDVYGGLAGTTNRTSDYFQADEGWWQAAYNNGEGGVYISEPEFDESANAVGVQIALPIRHQKTGEITGILRTTYIMTPLATILSEKIGQTDEADLLLPGEEVSRINYTGEYEEIEAEEFEALQAVFGQGMVEMEYEGEESVVTQATVQTLEGNPAVDNLGWIVVFTQEADEAFAPVNASIRGFIVVLLVVVALAAAAAFGFSLILVRPIIRLTATAEEIAGGAIDTRAEVTSSDEVGTLAEAFNTMTSQLREFIGTLEQRVADRTKAIATSSEVSRSLSTILDREELVRAVVEQVQESFGYYHAHIYQLQGDTLVMAGGTGEAGALMLSNGHTVQKGSGLVGRAADSNEAVLVPDTSQDPNWLPNDLLPDTKSEVAIPISVGNRVLGVLDVQQNVAEGLDQEDVDSLQSIANQVAAALQNVDQYESTQKMASDLEVVANVGIATSTITEGGHLLQEVVDLSKQSFELYHAHIYLLNEAGDTLELASGAGEVGRKMVTEEHAIPLDSEKSLVARAARTREGVVVNDVQANPDFLPNPLLPETRSEMAVPMIVGDKVIGVLDVQAEWVDRFTDIDVSIQTTLASQVAVALQNVRSFANAQKQAERETRLNTITQKIQGADTIEEAMQVAARELGHALGKRQTLVALDPAALAGDNKGTAAD
jgi:GAF domain-containing protein/HAMP domain-containing protein